MKLLTLLLVSIASVSLLHADQNKPVKVFILAGQSNMEGHGVVDMDHEKNYNGGKGNSSGP